jgi:hypothetical protein
MSAKELKTKIATASVLGTIAFKNGLKCIPSLDADLLELLKGLEVGNGSTKIMKAWLKSWTIANIG